MFKSITAKTKLLIPMFILTVILFFLGSMAIFYSYSQMQSLQKLNSKIVLSRYIAKTLHSLQKERGLSSGYIENKNQKFTDDLILQRRESDFQINRLKKIKEISQKNILLKFMDLSNIRKKVDLREISSDEVINYYSKLNNSLLDIIVGLSKSSHIPNITRDILAYVNFLYLKEYGGIERARGIAILSKKELTRDSLIDFTNIISIQNQNENMFLKYADRNIKEFYLSKKRNESFEKVKNIQNMIIFQDFSKINVDSKEWYEIITQKMNILDVVSRYIEKEITIGINSELKKVTRIFVLVSFLTVLSLIVFIMMLISFIRLANDEQRLRSVMNKYIITSITDLDGNILDVSDAFCKISGYSKSELIGKPHSIVRHPDTPKEVFKDIWSSIKSGKVWKGKVKNRKKDGDFYWVYANIEPLYNNKGKIDAYISVRLDITESEMLTLKIKEEERKAQITKEIMYQQSRLAQMGEMLSMIAHQWRQPLSAITATSGALSLKAKLDKLDSKTAVELADKIQNFSKHLSNTIDDFRDFFKTDKIKKETNFKFLVDDVLNIIKSSLENNNIKFLLHVKSYKNFFTYDNEIKQVLLNLIKNAEDVLKEKEVKNAVVYIEIDNFSLKVCDNAGGVDEEIIDKIFDPYFSTKKEKDGTGLGLYMSKTIVEEHCNGKLSVENKEFEDQYKNRYFGAVFTIALGE